MKKISKLLYVFTFSLLLFYPNASFAEFDFFRDITINMSKKDVNKLGAKACGEDLCMDMNINGQKFDSLFRFIQNKLSAVAITAKKTQAHYEAISDLMDKSALVPVYLEVNSEICDISELLKMGLSHEAALERFLSLTAKITKDSNIIMMYTDSATLDKITAKNDVLDNADIISPNGPLAIFLNDDENGASLLYTQFALLNII